MGKVTLDQLSKVSGFSPTTISRVLNGKAAEYRISSQTCDAVRRLAQDMGFQPNYFAQALRNKKTGTLGLILPNIKNPFFAGLASRIISQAKNYDKSVMLIDTMENEDMEHEALEIMVSRSIDGVILVPCSGSPDFIAKVSEDVPLILVDRYFEGSALPYVSTDNFKGGYECMKLLITSGHTNICCIKGPDISVTTKERLKGCRKAVEESSAAVDLRVQGNEFTIENGYVETKMCLSTENPPTAIFALSNTILLGAIKAIKEHGMTVPGDISLISFDDNLYLDFLNPPVTRIAQPVDTMADCAVKLLMDWIDHGNRPGGNILMTPEMIVRESVKNLHSRFNAD
jgi:LacI family transcriptional regulator